MPSPEPSCGLAGQVSPSDRIVPFLGPTGVGKTELAKTLAETLFDSENRRSHRHVRVR